MIIKYRKKIDTHTTYAIDLDDGRVELATINGETYVYVPGSRPTLHPEISESVRIVALTDDLRSEIKAVSPHVRLINQRVVERIRERYSENDELKIMSLYFIDPADPRIQECSDYKESCRAWGRQKKAEIGL